MDESRLDKLIERHEALAQSIELLIPRIDKVVASVDFLRQEAHKAEEAAIVHSYTWDQHEKAMQDHREWLASHDQALLKHQEWLGRIDDKLERLTDLILKGRRGNGHE